MPEPLQIIADIPHDDPRLGFEVYARVLSDAVRGGVPAQFTVGIYGSWGSGKSSLLKAIQKELDGDQDVIPVFFDAWRYERTVRWPEEYQDLLSGVLGDDRAPMVQLLETEDTALRRFGESFFDAKLTSDVLRPILQLTQAVASAKTMSESEAAE